MGTRTTTVTVTICDRCGRETADTLADWGGHGNVRQDSVGVTYDGATGGTTRNLLLCGRCDHALTEFLHGGGATPLMKDGTEAEHQRWAAALRPLAAHADIVHILTEANVTGRNYLVEDVLELADAIRAHNKEARRG